MEGCDVRSRRCPEPLDLPAGSAPPWSGVFNPVPRGRVRMLESGHALRHGLAAAPSWIELGGRGAWRVLPRRVAEPDIWPVWRDHFLPAVRGINPERLPSSDGGNCAGTGGVEATDGSAGAHGLDGKMAVAGASGCCADGCSTGRASHCAIRLVELGIVLHPGGA